MRTREIVGHPVVTVLIVMLGIVLRVISVFNIGLEVDEPVNLHITQSVQLVGQPLARGEINEPARFYLFHPPFGFYLMAEWADLVGSTMISARILAVIFSVVAIMLLWYMLRCEYGSVTANVALVFLATDSWLVITNAMYYLENLQLVLIVLFVWAYQRCMKDDQVIMIRCVLAGIALGLVFIFKHIGVFVVLGVFVYWLAERKKHKGNFIVLLTSGVVVLAYVVWAYSRWGDIWLAQTTVQLQRTLGLRASRGLNYDVYTVLEVIVARYWLFMPTIMGLILGAVASCLVYFIWLVKHLEPEKSFKIFVAWGMGAVLFATLTALKNPHYFMLWLFPFWTILSILIVGISHRYPRILRVVMLLTIVLNTSSFAGRVWLTQDDVLTKSAIYVETKLSPDVLVGTESYIGFMIPQDYVRYDQADTSDLIDLGVDYIVVYYSTTAEIPPGIGGNRVWEYCKPSASFRGFKDGVVICEIQERELKKYKP